MPSISAPHQRRDTLELKGDQRMATDEQIREHCPELFEATFYLSRLARVLEDIKFGFEGVLGSHLDEENQQKLDACVSHLTEVIKKTISEIPFELTVQQDSDDTEELHVIQNRSFTVTVGNAEALLESVKQPTQNLDTLCALSILIHTLEKRIEDLKEDHAIPNPKEARSVERSEIEISVLEAELKDFEEFEETGKPTAHQRNQKKQLKDDLEKHRGIIGKIRAKSKKRKERITSTQKILDQVVTLFTEFLAQYDPETSTNFLDELGLIKVLNSNRIDTNHVSSELTKVLWTKREGYYAAYYPEVESKQKMEERKLLMRRWVPRLAVVLALGGGLYATHEKIKTVLAGSQLPIAEWIMDEDERLEILKKDFEEELASDAPSDLTLMKARLFNAESSSPFAGGVHVNFTDELQTNILAASDWKELINAAYNPSKINLFFVGFGMQLEFRLSEAFLNQLRLFFGNDFELMFKINNREEVVFRPGEPPILDHTFDSKIFFKETILPELIIKRRVEEGGDLEVHRVSAVNRKVFDNMQKRFESIQASNKKAADEHIRNKKLIGRLKASILRHPLVLSSSARPAEEPYCFGTDFIEEVKTSDDLDDYLKKALPKLEVDQYAINLMEKIIRGGPHLAIVEIGPKLNSGVKIGDLVRSFDNAVYGSISLGIHNHFFSQLKQKFGSATKIKFNLYENGKPAKDLVLDKPFSQIQMGMLLDGAKNQCNMNAPINISVGVPFENRLGRGVQYANFEVIMNFSELIGTDIVAKYKSKDNLAWGYMENTFCEEINTFKIPGFSGSPAKLVKYMDLEGDLYQKMKLVKNDKEVEKYLPEILKRIKNNPQFKEDLNRVFSSISHLQFNLLREDSNGQVADMQLIENFPGLDSLMLNDTVSIGVSYALLTYLSDQFGKANFDLTFSAKINGTQHEGLILYQELSARELCQADIKDVSFVFKLSLTPDHSFSITIPIDFEREIAFIRDSFCDKSIANLSE